LPKEELLAEAELEVVASRRSPSRPRSIARSILAGEGYLSDESESPELALPGAWKRTPGKRKREQARATPGNQGDYEEIPMSSTDQCQNDKPWGVHEWKKLEKVFRAQREVWIKTRNIKPLPSTTFSFLTWSRRAMPAAKEKVAVKEFDIENVLDVFIEEENAVGFGGEWSR
jgi:serine/arginine repetitive matrix protein 2